MQSSTNYGFKLPEQTDFVNIEDLSDNWEKVDGILPQIDENRQNILALDMAVSILQQADVSGTTDNIAVEVFDDNTGFVLISGQYDSINHRVYA
jgi:hypothetical protein